MRSIKTFSMAGLLLMGGLLLSACAPNPVDDGTGTAAKPASAALLWFNTEVGTVKCLTFQVNGPGRGTGLIPLHNCDWSTLHTGTTAKAEYLGPGRWLTTGEHRIFCITEKVGTDPYSATYPSYDCDWVHPRAPLSQ